MQVKVTVSFCTLVFRWLLLAEDTVQSQRRVVAIQLTDVSLKSMTSRHQLVNRELYTLQSKQTRQGIIWDQAKEGLLANSCPVLGNLEKRNMRCGTNAALLGTAARGIQLGEARGKLIASTHTGCQCTRWFVSLEGYQKGNHAIFFFHKIFWSLFLEIKWKRSEILHTYCYSVKKKKDNKCWWLIACFW